MKPAAIDLTIYQGATFRKVLQWKAGSPAVPVDLTGCTARMHIRKTIRSEDILLECTTENGRITITPLDGEIAIEIPAVDTAALLHRSGVFDLEVEDVAGVVTRLLEGGVEISPEVTR